MTKKKSQKGKKNGTNEADVGETSPSLPQENGTANNGTSHDTIANHQVDQESYSPEPQLPSSQPIENERTSTRSRGLPLTDEAPTYESLLVGDSVYNGKYSSVAAEFEPLPEQSGSRTPLLYDHSIEEFLLEIPSSSRYADATSSPMAESERGVKRPNLDKERDGRCAVKLEWTSSAREVCVVFDSDWSVQHRMRRLASGTFEYCGRFSPFEVLQFKFVVDGNWRKSHHYPSVNQGRVSNNYVVPVLLEWTGAARAVFVYFLHQSSNKRFDETQTRHKLRYVKEKWTLDTTLEHVGECRFRFLVDGQWQANPKYPIEDATNVVAMTLPKDHKKNTYTGSDNAFVDDKEATDVPKDSEKVFETSSADQSTTQSTHEQPHVDQEPENEASRDLDQQEQHSETQPEALREHEPVNETEPEVHKEEEEELENSMEALAVANSEEEEKNSENFGANDDGAEVSLFWSQPDSHHVELRFDCDNWEKSHQATQLSSGVFQYSARFPANKILQFKFIVDGKWLISDDYYPYVDSNGNSNNFVVPVRLEWTEGGSDVWARTSCDKWAVTHPAKWENDRWVLHLTVPHTGQHQFKFVVDGEWRLASNYQAIQDGFGNSNNIFLC